MGRAAFAASGRGTAPPAWLLTAFVHECGQAAWRTAAGDTLEYMKVAFFEVYPRLAFTTDFDLGLTIVSGLHYGAAAYGIMPLGGSFKMNALSWILAPVLLKYALTADLGSR